MTDEMTSLTATGVETHSKCDSDSVYRTMASETLLYRQIASEISAESIRFSREALSGLSRIVKSNKKRNNSTNNTIPPDFEVARYLRLQWSTASDEEIQQQQPASSSHHSFSNEYSDSSSSGVAILKGDRTLPIIMGVCSDCGGLRDAVFDQIRIRSSSTTPISRTLRRRRSRARAKAIRKYKKEQQQQQQQQKSFAGKTTMEALARKNQSPMEFSSMTATCKNVAIWTCRFCGATSRIPGFYYNNNNDTAGQSDAKKSVPKKQPVPSASSAAANLLVRGDRNHRPNNDPTNHPKTNDVTKQSTNAAAEPAAVDEEDFIQILPQPGRSQERNNITCIPTNPKKKKKKPKDNKALLDFLSSLNG
jgi:hypothetical protein